MAFIARLKFFRDLDDRFIPYRKLTWHLNNNWPSSIDPAVSSTHSKRNLTPYT
ncbi:hypothetical protein SOM16_15005 [Pedobacter sp. CFBP9032]|nr:hypothetical protein [Pedobacter sp. CFBP9032]